MDIKEFENALQGVLDMPKFQMVKEARNSLGVVLQYYDSIEENPLVPAAFLISSIATFIAADGVVSEAEHEFLQAVLETEISFEDVCAMAQAAADDDFEEVVDAIIDAAPQKVKVNFLMLCAYFIACDGEITVEEQELLIKYLQQ